MARLRTIKCNTCEKYRMVAYGFMKDCHECTKVRGLRRAYKKVTV